MKNVILNVTTTGGWDMLTAGTGVPQRSRVISMQARTNVAMQYRYTGQTTYWTVKAGTVRTLQGEFWPEELEIQAAGGTVVEIEISTQLTI